VVLGDQGLHARQDRVGVLDELGCPNGRVACANVDRATGRLDPDPQLARGLDLGADHRDGTTRVLGKRVQLVGRGGAAGQQQLAQRDQRRGVDDLFVDRLPVAVVVRLPVQ
jgi:hypothetical protein